MRDCCSLSTPAFPRALRSFSWPACSIASRCCSAGLEESCGRYSPAGRWNLEAAMNVKDRTLTRRQVVVAGGCATAMFTIGPARAQGNGDRLKVVATFSILADLIGNVGASRIDGAMLVGPNGNAHVYAPSPADARKVAEARLVFINGLGFEGWLDRLVKASASRASIVVVSKGIKPRERESGGDRDHDHDHGQADPHAWQSVANVKIYARNICDALV